jgi:dihydrofolate synthase/folylpolyglutamate synthase
VPPAVLAEAARPYDVPQQCADDLPSALTTALAQADPDDLLCVTGSLYLVGEALRWWQDRPSGSRGVFP